MMYYTPVLRYFTGFSTLVLFALEVFSFDISCFVNLLFVPETHKFLYTQLIALQLFSLVNIIKVYILFS